MIYMLLLFSLQAVYSFLSTCRMNDAVGNKTLRYVLSAMASDVVKYSITAVIALQVVKNDNWLIILSTVIGGAVGNYLGHKYKRNNK